MTLGVGKGVLIEAELIKAFVEHATAHRYLFVEGDVKASNRAHDKLTKIAVKFRQIPDRGEHILRELIRSSNESVRGWAASPWPTGWAAPPRTAPMLTTMPTT